jgi:carboxymethylenebutenolidase
MPLTGSPIAAFTVRLSDGRRPLVDGQTFGMIERFVDISTGDGDMNTFIVHPEENGPHPLVLFLMDAPGMREEIRDMSRRLATAGYYVMSPQLYYRDVAEFNVFETGDRDRMFELMSHLSNEMVANDAVALIAHADADQAAGTSAVGVVGYCMSGPFAIYLAGRIPDRVKAAASFHGVRLVTDADDSPHLQLPETNAEVYVGAAEVDAYAPPEMIDAFERAIETSGCRGRVEWYPGTEHGFTFRERGPLYDKPASERHWERLHDLFSRNLLR